MKRGKARTKGEGSIYQDGESFVAQITIKGQLFRRRCKTEQDALTKLDELRQKRRKRLSLTNMKPTFSDWFETWLNSNRRIKEGVRADYRRNIATYALPAIGRYRIDEITAELLQDMVNELDDRGLAPNTIKNVAARIRTALNRAMRNRLIDFNPAIGLELPSGRNRLPVALTQDEALALLEAVKVHRLYALYYLALSLGLRQGELLALKWSDISWKHATLTIQRTLRRNGKSTIEDTTKTEAGQRVLDLSDAHLEVLRTHWTNQQEAQALAERLGQPAWNKDKRVFCNEIGREIAARNLLRQFATARKAAKLPKLAFHDLRHTAGSLMLWRGSDMLDVSKILGHSSMAVTAKIYAHSYSEKRKKAIIDLAMALLQRPA
jgi:integrase